MVMSQPPHVPVASAAHNSDTGDSNDDEDSEDSEDNDDLDGYLTRDRESRLKHPDYQNEVDCDDLDSKPSALPSVHSGPKAIHDHFKFLNGGTSSQQVSKKDPYHHKPTANSNQENGHQDAHMQGSRVEREVPLKSRPHCKIVIRDTEGRFLRSFTAFPYATLLSVVKLADFYSLEDLVLAETGMLLAELWGNPDATLLECGLANGCTFIVSPFVYREGAQEGLKRQTDLRIQIYRNLKKGSWNAGPGVYPLHSADTVSSLLHSITKKYSLSANSFFLVTREGLPISIDNDAATLQDCGILDGMTLYIYEKSEIPALKLRPILEPEHRGISLVNLQKICNAFLIHCKADGWTSTNPMDKGKPLKPEEVTLYDLVEHYIQPLTRAHQCSYTELVCLPDEDPTPDYFVSHWYVNNA
jgi:hypothetical protein